MNQLAVFLIAAVLSAAGGEGVKPRVELTEGDHKIDVIIDGKLFTSYRYDEQLTKPILFPVYTPSHAAVNRGYPLEKAEGETTDHPHHTGIFMTYDKVNDEGFWNNTQAPPQIKHIKVVKMQGGAGSGRLSTIMHWVGKSGQVLLEENRTMVFTAEPNEYAIDFNIDLAAKDIKVVLGDTKEGMFAIRTAEWLKEEGGTGTYLSSNGDQKEENVWGKKAKWMRLQGQKDGKPIGIAIFNHPTSVNYPTYWHARAYGLFAANPLGQYDFEKKKNPETARKTSITLEPGQKIHLRFLMVIYEGDRTKEQLEKQFESFVKKGEDLKKKTD
jgi:hypothetical protein